MIDFYVNLYFILFTLFISSQDVKDTGVLECRIFNNSKFYTGVAVLTGAFNIYLVNNIKEPRIRKMPAVPGIEISPWIAL